MITDCTDQIAAYEFDNTVSDDYGQDKIGDKKLIPTATIEIKINPEQPYWERPLEVHSYNVYPETSAFWSNWIGQWGKWEEWQIPRLDVDVWQFGTDYWTLHTPFKVAVYKNGELIGETAEPIDTIGGVETLRIPTSGEEYITIQNLGQIGWGYTEPTFDILMFSESTVFHCSDSLINRINYDAVDLSYSNYWFGGGQHYQMEWGSKMRVVQRFDDECTSPGHHFLDPDLFGRVFHRPVTDESFPGNERDGQYNAKPISADIWNDQPYLNPYGKSLVNYLKQYHDTVNLNVWKQGYRVHDSKLKINLPFGSMSSLVTLKISTELADTIVWNPQVGNFKVTDFHEIGDIPDRKFGYIKIKQLSDVDSSGSVIFSVSPSNLPVDVNPPTIGTGTMTLGEEKILTFEMTNLGTETELTGTLTATINNSIGSVTDQRSVGFTLLVKGAGNTVLTVYTLDKNTRAYVSGISLIVNWEGGSTTGITSEGSWTYDFGAVHPLVTVTSAETPTYKSASDSKPLEVGTNSITLELILQTAPPEFPWIWVLIIVVVIVVVVLAVIIYWRLRR